TQPDENTVSAPIAVSDSGILGARAVQDGRVNHGLPIPTLPASCSAGLGQRRPAAWRANASGLVAVRSTVGSTVENDSMSSLNLALLVNCANGSLLSGGQFRIPVRKLL